MSLSAIVLEESPVRLWGLSSRQRLRRQLREAGGVQWLDSLDRLTESGRVLLLNGNYLFEVRTLAGLLERLDDGDEVHLGFEYAFLRSGPLIAVRGGWWYDPAHQILYQAMITLRDTSQPIDLVAHAPLSRHVDGP